jgi:hypothetical protein
MAELQPSRMWMLLACGALAGWLVGVLWAVGRAILLGAEHGVAQAVRSLAQAPLLAAPWACVGVIAAAVARAVRGPWVTTAAALTTLRGAVCALATFPPQAWAAGTAYCLGWSLAGIAAGAAYGLACRRVLTPAPPTDG